MVLLLRAYEKYGIGYAPYQHSCAPGSRRVRQALLVSGHLQAGSVVVQLLSSAAANMQQTAAAQQQLALPFCQATRVSPLFMPAAQCSTAAPARSFSANQ